MLSATTLPISSVIRVAKSSARSMIISNTDRSTSPRSRAGVAAQVSCTAHAASIAESASAAVALPTEMRTSSVAGLRTSKVDDAGRSSPPIHSPVGTEANSRSTSRMFIPP